MKRWRAWKKRQRSQVRYGVVPSGTRIVPSGLVATVAVVEILDWRAAWL